MTLTVLPSVSYADLGLKNKKIVIDPGHGPDSGAVGLNGLSELDLNLKVAQYLKQYLTDAGAVVVLTREDNTGPYSGRTVAQSSLAARVKLATEEQCDLFVSIHHNANAQLDRSVNQIEVFYNIYDFGPSKDAAEKIFDALVKELNIPKGYPVQMPAEYYVLRKAVGYPAVLGEAAFITNPQAESLLKTDEYQQREAKAYFNGIRQYFGAGTLKIANVFPADGTIFIDDAKPKISADIVEEKGGPGIDPNSVQVKLDGELVPHQLHGNKINFIPSTLLSNDQHTISIDVRNKKGNAALTAKNTFFVNLPAETIEVKVSPKTLPPDGSAEAVIIAVVRDRNANLVGNGILVTFLADNRFLGNALTEKGLAKFYFTGKPYITTTPIVGITDAKSSITTIESNLENQGMIIGSVQSQAGMPINAAEVKLVQSSITKTDSDGKFFVSELGPGTYPVTIAANGYNQQTKSIEVKAGLSSRTDFVLTPSDEGIFQNKIFIIDPAFGGAQSGAVGPTGLVAAQVNLKVALYLQELLERAGAKVIMTRTDNEHSTTDIEKAVLDANSDNNLFVIINQGHSSDSSQNYSAIYHYPGQQNALSKSILASLKKKFGYPLIPYTGQYGKDGVIDNSDYIIVQTYGIRIEPSLITNPEEEKRLQNDRYLKEEAQAIYDGMLDYYTGEKAKK